MTKHEAIRRLGGTPTSAARAIGITVGGVCNWPERLPKSVEDRVIAAIARHHFGPFLATAEIPATNQS